MAEIDYKQLAKNIVSLVEFNIDRKTYEVYIKWELKQKQKKNINNYNKLCDCLFILNLPILTEEKWKKG
jgi:hypothetical protein